MTHDADSDAPRTLEDVLADMHAGRYGDELIVRRNRRDAAAVIDDLRAAGYDVDWISDLRRLGVKYHSAVPILIGWLPRVDNRNVLESVVRTLSVPWARPQAARPLIELFARTADEMLRWAIANGLEVVADDSVYDDLLRLFSDPASGRARQMLALALSRFPKRAATSVPVLLKHLDEPDIYGHVIIALGRLRADVADAIRPFERDERAWVRSEARKALKRISKVHAGSDTGDGHR